jgi:hypothetical protein
MRPEPTACQKRKIELAETRKNRRPVLDHAGLTDVSQTKAAWNML